MRGPTQLNGRVESVEICINATVCIDNIPPRDDQMHETSSNGDIYCVKNTFDWRLKCDDHWNVVNFDCEHEAWSTPSCNHQAICFLSQVYYISWHHVSKLWIEGRSDTTLIYTNELDRFYTDSRNTSMFDGVCIRL